METLDLDAKLKALKYAIWGGLASIILIMFGSYYNSWQKQEFTSGGISCVKEPLAEWVCTVPELESLKSSSTDINSRSKSEILSEQDIVQLINDKAFQEYRDHPKVRAYINHAKEDGKITKDESNLIYQLIDEAAKKRESTGPTSLVNQL